MKTQNARTIKLSLALSLLGIVSACAVAVPLPAPETSNSGDATQAANNTPDQAQAAGQCNIEGEESKDLQDGTTKVTIKQSCENTEISIVNNHKTHAKKCRLSIGQASTELYVQSGDKRTLTHTGPVQRNRIAVSCVNDWNKPK